jgi:aryl-alcohol dehydrogenase-like predicted oxidoreductase
MTFGGQADERTALEIMDVAAAAGINFFDTADVYQKGRSEELVGKWLQGRRDRIVLATKVYGATGDGPNDRGLSRAHILGAVEASLRRLRTDYLDLYQAHHPDPEAPLDETLRALDDLARQGKVRYLGCSNYSAWQVCKALWISDAESLARFDCVQPRYNLLYREIERELLPLCADQGLGVIVYNPLAGGMLTGKYSRESPPPPDTRMGLREIYRERYWHARNFDAIDRLCPVAARHGHSLVQLALAWVLSRPTITSAIVGATAPAQLQQSLSAVGLPLGEEELRACDEVWEALRGRDPSPR